MIVGSVTWDRGGVETTATLDDHGQWSCPDDPSAAEMLRLIYRDDLAAGGPRDEAYKAVLNRAAAQVRGVASVEPTPEPDEQGTSDNGHYVFNCVLSDCMVCVGCTGQPGSEW